MARQRKAAKRKAEPKPKTTEGGLRKEAQTERLEKAAKVEAGRTQPTMKMIEDYMVNARDALLSLAVFMRTGAASKAKPRTLVQALLDHGMLTEFDLEVYSEVRGLDVVRHSVGMDGDGDTFRLYLARNEFARKLVEVYRPDLHAELPTPEEIEAERTRYLSGKKRAA